jgi:hypothetical protein
MTCEAPRFRVHRNRQVQRLGDGETVALAGGLQELVTEVEADRVGSRRPPRHVEVLARGIAEDLVAGRDSVDLGAAEILDWIDTVGVRRILALIAAGEYDTPSGALTRVPTQRPPR